MFLNVSENAVITSKGPDQQADLCKKKFFLNVDFSFDVTTFSPSFGRYGLVSQT